MYFGSKQKNSKSETKSKPNTHGVTAQQPEQKLSAVANAATSDVTLFSWRVGITSMAWMVAVVTGLGLYVYSKAQAHTEQENKKPAHKAGSQKVSTSNLNTPKPDSRTLSTETVPQPSVSPTAQAQTSAQKSISPSTASSATSTALSIVATEQTNTPVPPTAAVSNETAIDRSKPCDTDVKAAYTAMVTEEQQAQQAISKPARININRASEGELASLEGIGSSKAQEIILYREMFGGFTRVEDLSKVKGIGDKIVEANRSRLSVHD